jgi:hypothetical protein
MKRKLLAFFSDVRHWAVIGWLVVLTAFLWVSGLSITVTGCTTTPSGTNTTGSATNAVDPAVVTRMATVLRTAVGDSVILAMEKSPSSVDYLVLGKTVLDAFIAGSNFSPVELRKSLQAISTKLQSAEARIAINTVASLYEIYWGDYVRNRVAGNVAALELLTAARNGMVDGLAEGVSVP